MEKSLLPCSDKTTSLFAAALCTLCAALGTTGAVSIGGESGAYLRAPLGAEASAMGGAGSADPTQFEAWWNPAALAANRPPRAGAGMGVRSLGRMEGFAGGAFRIPPRAGLGLTVLYRGDPFLDNLRDADENVLGNGGFTTLSLRAGAGYVLTRKITVGASIGFFHQRLSTEIAGAGKAIGASSVTGIGGFDLALRYRHSDALAISALVRKLGLSMDWEVRTGDFDLSSTSTDAVLPELVLASRLDKELLGRPFAWTAELIGYVFAPGTGLLERPEAILNNGFHWQYWERFALRAGIAELPLSGRIVSDNKEYFDSFSLRICAGFEASLDKLRPGIKIGYALMSDKVYAGVDQVLEIRYSF